LGRCRRCMGIFGSFGVPLRPDRRPRLRIPHKDTKNSKKSQGDLSL
jgi:hypothetical protein